MKSALALIAFAMLSQTTFAQDATVQEAALQMPPGDYTYSCDNCQFDGRYLSCSCRTSGGQWYDTTLDWGGRCGPSSFVQNLESRLSCN